MYIYALYLSFMLNCCTNHDTCMYALQNGCSILHYAAKKGLTTSVERLLSTPGIDVNVMDGVSSFMNYSDADVYLL